MRIWGFPFRLMVPEASPSVLLPSHIKEIKIKDIEHLAAVSGYMCVGVYWCTLHWFSVYWYTLHWFSIYTLHWFSVYWYTLHWFSVYWYTLHWFTVYCILVYTALV